VAPEVIRPRPFLVAAFLGLTLLALPASAGAVLPGKNGKIVFVSGRDDGATPFSNAASQVWILDQPGGAFARVSNNAAFQHRHPSWSPDYTKVVYAAGAGGDWDLWIQDLTQPLSATNPRNITNTVGVPDDRPSWSPDGTRIAWEARLPSAIQDVFVMTIATGATTKLSAAVAGADAGKPAWSPDSQTIFYSQDTDVGANTDNDIVKEPAGNSNGAGAIGVVTTIGVSDFQPAVSADGQNLCFTEGAFNNTAKVWRSNIAGGSPMLIANSTTGDYNCVWSPDGTKIAYTQGAGASAGALAVKNSDGSSGTGPETPLANHVSMRFDGNPDWARNGAPTCQSSNLIVEKNTPVTIALSCSDPPPENGGTTKSIVSAPVNGTLGGGQQGQPATVVYTPKKDFTGPDIFTYKGNDGVSDSAAVAVQITVHDTKAANISRFSAGRLRWRRGSLLPAFFSRRLAPVGTTFSFKLDETAKATLTFALRATGRRVGKQCKAPTRSRRFKPKCTRYLTKGSIAKTVKAGTTRVRFQGRITSRSRLALGTYRLTLDVVDLAGNHSKSKIGYFTIVLLR
jgi:Tol biopolymer transport system component